MRDRNTYREQQAIKSIDQLMNENIKHEQNKLFVKKREHVQFDFEMAQSLLQGKFHGEPADEDLNQAIAVKDLDELDHAQRLR